MEITMKKLIVGFILSTLFLLSAQAAAINGIWQNTELAPNNELVMTRVEFRPDQTFTVTKIYTDDMTIENGEYRLKETVLEFIHIDEINGEKSATYELQYKLTDDSLTVGIDLGEHPELSMELTKPTIGELIIFDRIIKKFQD